MSRPPCCAGFAVAEVGHGRLNLKYAGLGRELPSDAKAKDTRWSEIIKSSLPLTKAEPRGR